MNSLANTLDGQQSDGTSAPDRVQERLNPSFDSARLGKRVAPPMCSAANWSSEMLLRKPARRLRMRGGGQKAVDRVVTVAHLRMRETGDDREIVPEILEHLQVRARACSPCRLFAERNTADAAPAACRCRPCGAAARRRRPARGSEPWRRARAGQRDAGGPQETAAGQLHGKGPRLECYPVRRSCFDACFACFSCSTTHSPRARASS